MNKKQFVVSMTPTSFANEIASKDLRSQDLSYEQVNETSPEEKEEEGLEVEQDLEEVIEDNDNDNEKSIYIMQTFLKTVFHMYMGQVGQNFIQTKRFQEKKLICLF